MDARRRFLWLVVPSGLLALALALRRAGHPFLGGLAVVVAVEVTMVAVLVGWPRSRRLLPAVAPILVSSWVGLYGATDGGNLRGIAAGDPGFTDRAAALAAAGLLVALLLAAGLDVARGIERAVTWVGGALTALLAGALFVLALIPAWGWSKVRRRDPIRSAGAGAHGSTWQDHVSGAGAATSLGSHLGGATGGRSLTGRLTWGLGCVVLLLGANYGVGWAWDRAADADVVPPAVADRTNIDTTTPDPRAEGKAMAAYPWRYRYFADIQRTTGGYWPFTEYRPNDFTSPYVNQRGWLRRSYQPKAAAASRPTVWMFGGSTTWGEGQRDEYTIASWVSRLAEQDRLPLRMDNYGERGWTHFQEMVLYEQQLATEPDPDFSIFYDGANEVTTQSLLDVAVPSHTLAYTYALKLTGQTIATQFVPKPGAGNVLGDLWHEYSQHSAIHKLAAALRPDPAGAAPVQDPAGTDPGTDFTGGQDQREDGGIYDYQMTDQDGTDAGKVYERVKQFTMSLSQRYQVRSFLFWQPMGYTGGPYAKAIAELTPPTIDISDTLNGLEDQVFIDGGHTNEEGARLVAVEIWKYLKPAVETWYEEHP